MSKWPELRLRPFTNVTRTSCEKLLQFLVLHVYILHAMFAASLTKKPHHDRVYERSSHNFNNSSYKL